VTVVTIQAHAKSNLGPTRKNRIISLMRKSSHVRSFWEHHS